MEAERKKISDEEILYFYNFLYEYEHDGSHAGYKPALFLQELGNLVIVNDNYDKKANINKLEQNNLHFTPYNKNLCWAIMYHIRNSIAHGNLYSTCDGQSFLIFDYSDKEKRSRCTMSGKVEKTKLYKLLSLIQKTRKL